MSDVASALESSYRSGPSFLSVESEVTAIRIQRLPGSLTVVRSVGFNRVIAVMRAILT